MSNDQDFPYYQHPGAIRGQSFSRRRRGYDVDEVAEYLDLLADQVKACEKERETLLAHGEQLRSDNDRLRTELQQIRAQVDEAEHLGDRVNDQVVELFSAAQLVAEEMVEDVSRDARQRLSQARAQERQILEEAVQAAERTRREAEAMIARTVPGPATSSPPLSSASAEVQQLRSVAQAAQAQMQTIMDSFATEVARLAESPTGLGGWQIEGPREGGRDSWTTD